ncbi:MAG TPA: SLC13 family permease [Spirochaetes bacterium]|nr:SLC13 family permease [Spirochaetota bacterium]
MTLEIAMVFGVILFAVVLFVTEKISVDLTAICAMGLLMVLGIITPEEGVSGFSNSATVTVAAMLVISGALAKTGSVNFLGSVTSKIFKYNFWCGMLAALTGVAVISAFVNNTPVMAVFIPVLLGVARENNISPSKLLMPVSFASILGGVCTLIGTSTNILVNSIAVKYGQPAFGMFEFSALGVVFLTAGISYLMLAGVRMIPQRTKEEDLISKYDMGNYVTDIILLPEAASVGSTVIDSPLVKEIEIDILNIKRDNKRLTGPIASTILRAHDVLRVHCDMEQLRKIKERIGVMLQSDYTLGEDDFKEDEITLVEAIVAPSSGLINKTIKTSWFRNIYRATALAIRHRGQLMHNGFLNTILKAGDAILLEVTKENYVDLKKHRDFVIVSDVDTPVYRKSKIIPSLLITAGVITAAATSVLPIMVSAIIGCILLIVTKCISIEEAYESIDWKIIFLLGGILSLGLALQKSGGAMLIAGGVLKTLGPYGPVVVLSVLYLLTSVLTEMMSNNATAVLLAPIAIIMSEAMGVSPRPMLMAVAFAASCSFMTPVGYQTNTMIYGVGKYRFFDFLKVGTPLALFLWLTATLLIPRIYPF